MTAWHASCALVVYAAATAYCTWPLARLSADYIFPRGSPDDILLVLWILSWDVHAIRTGVAQLFDGNILHPASAILRHSEHMLGALPFFAPTNVSTGDPVLALNVVMLASFVLGGFFMHALLWSWTGSAVAAFVAGLAFALAPWRINGLNWPHLLSTQYMPLVVLGLERTVMTRRPSAIALLALALSLQLLASYYLAQMTALVVAAFVVANLGTIRSRRSWAALAAGLAPPLAALLLISMPYLDAQREGLLRRGHNDQALEILATFGQPLAVLRGFVGWGPLALALVALAPADGFTRKRAWTLAVLLVVALIISPGPRGLWNDVLPLYSWLEAVVPGFSLVRVPFRFGILASFAAAAMAGLGAWALLRWVPSAPRSLRWVVPALLVGCALSPAFTVRVPPAATLPTRADLAPAYAWLATHGEGGPLLELPMQERRVESGWAWDRAGARAMYFSTYHWLPLLNGYTGYLPPSAAAVEELAARLPSADALRVLVDCAGLRWILLHRPTPRQIETWQQADGLRLAGVFPGAPREDRIFEVVIARSGACGDGRFPGSPSRPVTAGR